MFRITSGGCGGPAEASWRERLIRRRSSATGRKAEAWQGREMNLIKQCRPQFDGMLGRFGKTLILVGGVALVGSIGRVSTNAAAPTTFVITVDSVIVPSTIDPEDTLTLELFGKIGPNLCYRFKEFEAQKTDSLLNLTVLGIVPDLRDLACAAEVAELRGQGGQRGKEYRVAPPFVDPFQIVILQADSSTLEIVVRVLASK